MVTVGVTPEAPVQRGSDYAALKREICSAGLLDRRPLSYALRAAATITLYCATIVAIVVIGNSWYQLICAAVLTIAFGQLAFLGHDAGHQAIFASRRANDALGRSLGVLVGLSYGWWVDTHNRHHANPNDVERDPDIEDGVLIYTPAQSRIRGNAISRFVGRRQAWLFFPLLTLQGISMHADSIVAVVTDKFRSPRGGTRRFEAIGLAMHAVLYVSLLLLVMSPTKALAFFAVNQALFGIYMGCSFAPNHKGMPLIGPDDRVDYLRRQVLTSRNVRGGTVTDLALGGLELPDRTSPVPEHASCRAAPREADHSGVLRRARGQLHGDVAHRFLPRDAHAPQRDGRTATPGSRIRAAGARTRIGLTRPGRVLQAAAAPRRARSVRCDDFS